MEDPQPVERKPDELAYGWPKGSRIRNVTYAVWVRVEWTDGRLTTEPGWTHEWTATHVYVALEETPPGDTRERRTTPLPPSIWTPAENVRRRQQEPMQRGGAYSGPGF
jgi:hypothetical protein